MALIHRCVLPVAWLLAGCAGTHPIDSIEAEPPLIDVTAERRAARASLVIGAKAANFNSTATSSLATVPVPTPPSAADVTPGLIWRNALGVTDATSRDQLIDAAFDRVPVSDALQSLAVMASQNLIIEASSPTLVSLHLKQVRWDVVFNALLSLGDLVVKESDAIIWVTQAQAAARAAKREPLVTRTFALNYARATVVASFLNGDGLRLPAAPAKTPAEARLKRKKVTNGSLDKALADPALGNLRGLLSPRGVVLAEARTNQLFVSELPDQMPKVASLIAQLDRPVQQVLIQARIVEADDGFSQALGVRLGSGLTRQLTDTPNVDLSAGGLAGRRAATLALALYRPGVGRFITAELSALETSGRGQIVARPSIVTSNGVTARIEQGTEYPYQSQNADGLGSVQFRKASLRLAVTPRITPNGHVMLQVNINKDSRGETTAQGVAINTKHVETQVLVENAGTVVIGGIFERYDRADDIKVPFLGDLPGIGVLFRTRSKRSDKSEMLIFLTPYILKSGFTD